MRITALLLAFAAVAVAAERLVPARVTDDFQHTSLGQWASYPPVQDIGYDPSISPSTEYGAPGGRSLMRIFRSPGPGAWSFGFIRRFDLASLGGTKIALTYRLKPAPAGASIEVGIAGANGTLYRKRTAMTASDTWANAGFDFSDIPSGVAIEAIYITAQVPNADPDLDYRFLIDNVNIEAAQPARFEIAAPKSVAIAHWKDRVSSVSYAPGERISFDLKAPVALKSVTCTLQDQEGQTRKSGSLSQQANLWKADSFYAIQSSDTPGYWRATFRGQTADGSEVTTAVRLIVRSNRTNQHPRLQPSNRTFLQQRINDPQFQPAWKDFSELAKTSRTTGDLVAAANGFSRLDTQYLLPTLFGYFSVINRANSRILNNALVGYVSHDETALSAAKQGMMDVSQWPRWAPPWFEAHGQRTYYPAGELAATMAFGYDVLYDSFSLGERSGIVAAMREHGIRATFEEYVADNRLMAGTSNWIGHTVGGALLAASAIDDGKDDAQLNIWMGGLLLKLEDHLAASYLADGSYGEGISYQEFDLKTTAPALTALRNTFGIDYWKHSHVKSSLTYPLYSLAFPPSAGSDMGDSHPPTGYSSASIAELSDDPTVKWYFSHFSPKSPVTFLSDVKGTGAPPKDVSRLFEEKGTTIFRTGWTPDDAIVMFRAGPNFNHNHSDQGSFLLRAFGEDLATEAGFAGYYKDPYYLPYFTQAVGHNTVLVNGDTASQDIADTAQFAALHRHPEILSVTLGAQIDSVASELAPVYREKLAHFGRSVQFIKPNYLVIYDELESAGAAATFDWLLHVKDNDALTLSPSEARYQGAKAAMVVKPIEPASPVMDKTSGHLPESLFATTIPLPVPAVPGILKLRSDQPARVQRFLVVLAFDRSESSAAQLASKVTRVNGNGYLGAKIGATVMLFRDPNTSAMDFENWRTDGRSLIAGDTFFSVASAKTVTQAGKLRLASDVPVTLSVESDVNGADVFVDTRSAANVQLALAFRPSKVPQNAKLSNDTIAMHLDAGRHRFRFEKQTQ